MIVARKRDLLLLAVTSALALMLGAAGAAEPDYPSLEARLDRLERQNEELAAQNAQLQRGLETANSLMPAGHGNWAAAAGVGESMPGSRLEFSTLPPAGGPVQQVQQVDYEVPQYDAGPVPGAPPAGPMTQQQVELIVKDYLQAHPAAGVTPGNSAVQVGYTYGQGFTIRSTVNAKKNNLGDCLKDPIFELRLRGRMQIDYYDFHITDNNNFQTGFPFAPTATGSLKAGRADFSALEVKRLRLILEGFAFDPDLKYRIQLNGDTRGLGGFTNDNDLTNGSPANVGAAAVGSGGGVTIDHAIRLFECWTSYDFHPGAAGAAPGEYTPTVTAIAGKLKPFCALEEYLGSGTDQFVEFSMADWFFSPDDDNLLLAAGLQYKALENRLYMCAYLTNGSESNFAVSQMDDRPGFSGGMWYDFGGTWDEKKRAWQLFGDSTADNDWHCDPVLRIGAGANLVSMDRRALYGDVEESRFRGAVGGASMISILNGAYNTSGGTNGTILGSGNGAVDKFDAQTINMYLAAKWHGLSIDNEYFVRCTNNFRGTMSSGTVFYTAIDQNGKTVASLLPVNSMTDYGMILQGGCFLVPTKLEMVARWSAVRGESGNIDGTGPTTGTAVGTVNGRPVYAFPGAFRNYSTANEYTLGVNWYFRRHLLKWQTDVGFYTGGTPASASAAGFINNADGWLARTQIQLSF